MGTAGIIGLVMAIISAVAGTAITASRGRNYSRSLAEDSASVDYEFNKRTAEDNVARQKELFDYEFNANSPSSQRKRLEAAGLSKASMFEGSIGQPVGSFGDGSSAFNPRSMIQGADIQAATENMQRGALLSAQIRNLDANTKLQDNQASTESFRQIALQADANLKSANTNLSQLEAVGQELANAFNKSNYDNQLTIQGLNIADLTQKLDLGREELISAIRANKIGSIMDLRKSVAAYMQQCVLIKVAEAQQRLYTKQGNVADAQVNMLNSLAEMYTSQSFINDMMTKGFTIERDGKTVEIPPMIQSQAVSDFYKSNINYNDFLYYYPQMITNMIGRILPF